MAKQFNAMPNIGRARVTETVGEMVLELAGADDSLELGIDYLREQGAEVTGGDGDILE